MAVSFSNTTLTLGTRYTDFCVFRSQAGQFTLRVGLSISRDVTDRPLEFTAHILSGASALCRFGDEFAGFGLASALFGIGLFGGLFHCGPMCGPFVLMQLPNTPSAPLSLRRLAGDSLPAYHLGRATTYVGLGAASGGLGATVADMTELRWVLAAPLLLAAAIFLCRALRMTVGSLSAGGGGRLPALLGRRLAHLSLVLGRGGQRRGGGFFLGLLLGFLPCGFLYAAVIAAGSGGSAGSGALAMAGFALGTAPTLLAVGMVGSFATQHWRAYARGLAVPVYLFSAATLGGMALRLAG